MSLHRIPVLRLICGAACVATGWLPTLSSGAPPETHASAPAPTSGDSAQMLAAIRAEIGDAACDNDLQCASLAVGAKACGGPETYLAWSGKGADRGRMAEFVTRHREARLREIERSGMASDCRVLVNPGAVCRPRAPDGKRVCQLGQGGQGRVD